MIKNHTCMSNANIKGRSLTRRNMNNDNKKGTRRTRNTDKNNANINKRK